MQGTTPAGRAAQPPFDSVRVLDLSRDLAAAYAARLFVWCGADVLKVEPPSGDVLRYDGPPGVFDALNAGKRSLGLDVASADGAALFRALILDFDLVIEDWKPGELDRLGIGYAALFAEKPRLVHLSVTPFGLHGPLAARDASPAELIAGAGASADRIDAGAVAVRVGLHAFAAAATALYAALVTEVGHHVEVAAIEALRASHPPGARLSSSEHGAPAAPPFSFGATVEEPRPGPPALGEHTDEVLFEELGLDGDEVARLREAGVV